MTSQTLKLASFCYQVIKCYAYLQQEWKCVILINIGGVADMKLNSCVTLFILLLVTGKICLLYHMYLYLSSLLSNVVTFNT